MKPLSENWFTGTRSIRIHHNLSRIKSLEFKHQELRISLFYCVMYSNLRVITQKTEFNSNMIVGFLRHGKNESIN